MANQNCGKKNNSSYIFIPFEERILKYKDTNALGKKLHIMHSMLALSTNKLHWLYYYQMESTSSSTTFRQMKRIFSRVKEKISQRPLHLYQKPLAHSELGV